MIIPTPHHRIHISLRQHRSHTQRRRPAVHSALCSPHGLGDTAGPATAATSGLGIGGVGSGGGGSGVVADVFKGGDVGAGMCVCGNGGWVGGSEV